MSRWTREACPRGSSLLVKPSESSAFTLYLESATRSEMVTKEIDFDRVVSLVLPFETASIKSRHASSIAADWPFVVEICEPMVSDAFRFNRDAMSRLSQQPPRSASLAVFQQEVPMQKGMIVRENRESWHKSRSKSIEGMNRQEHDGRQGRSRRAQFDRSQPLDAAPCALGDLGDSHLPTESVNAHDLCNRDGCGTWFASPTRPP